MSSAALQRQIASAGGRHFGDPRFAGYLIHCGEDAEQALAFYQWNVEASAAFWETIGHLEVVLRNRVASRLADRHQHLGRAGSWLDLMPTSEFDNNARQDVEKARVRLQRKQKPVSDGQIIAELGFGFWRFLFARRYTATLWPAIAGAFPQAPGRRRETVEAPVVRLHVFRNRLAHHERIWNQPLSALYGDALTVLRFMDGDLSRWVARQSPVPKLLADCPQPRPLA